MKEKATRDLEQELLSAYPKDMSKYINENKDVFIDGRRNFMEYMNQKLKEKGMQKQDVLLRADISQGYGYKLLNEEKHTRQRDVILRICYAAELTLQETQHVLKLYRMEELYAKISRDAFIMTCFNKRPGSIIEVNELMVKNKIEPLRTSGTQD